MGTSSLRTTSSASARLPVASEDLPERSRPQTFLAATSGFILGRQDSNLRDVGTKTDALPLRRPTWRSFTKHPPGAVNDSLHQPTNARRFLREAPITWEAQVIADHRPHAPPQPVDLPKEPCAAGPGARSRVTVPSAGRVQGRRASAGRFVALFSVLLPGACRRGRLTGRGHLHLLGSVAHRAPAGGMVPALNHGQTALRERARLQAERRSSLTRTRAKAGGGGGDTNRHRNATPRRRIPTAGRARWSFGRWGPTPSQAAAQP